MKNIMFWVRRYVMIYGIIMLCTFFMCLLFNPTSQLPVVSYFGRIMVFTLLSLISMVVYYSRDELTPKGPCCCRWPIAGASGTAGRISSSMLFSYCWRWRFGTWWTMASAPELHRRSTREYGRTDGRRERK